MRVGILAVVSVLVLAGMTLAQVDPFAPDPVYTPPIVRSSLPSGMEFVTIPSGSFMMGSPTSESNRDNNEDQHWVTVSSFELMTTEVTQGMWEEVMGESLEELRDIANPEWPLRGVGDDYPVYYVSWNDCQDFIDELNDLDPAHTYRLPTEAEWEYACRAGTTTAYYWGGTIRGSYCWYSENSNASAHPVGHKLPNDWGLYDMSGNVWEWCEDVYTRDYEDCPTNGAAFTGSGSDRVLRGGGWYIQICRSADRHSRHSSYNFLDLGFRLARSAR